MVFGLTHVANRKCGVDVDRIDYLLRDVRVAGKLLRARRLQTVFCILRFIKPNVLALLPGRAEHCCILQIICPGFKQIASWSSLASLMEKSVFLLRKYAMCWICLQRDFVCFKR